MPIKKQKSQKKNNKVFSKILFFLFLLFLPTQLGRHFFFSFSYLSGIRSDYLAPTIYLTDVLATMLFLLNMKTFLVFLTNKKTLIFLSFLILTIPFAHSPAVALYRFIKIIELVGVGAIAKQYLTKSFLPLAFALSGFFELLLASLQFVNKHSVSGIFYYFGERAMNLSTPSVAKISLFGIETLRPYGTFSHPNSMAGFYFIIYLVALTTPLFEQKRPLRIAALFASTLLIFLSFSKFVICAFVLFNMIYLIRVKLRDCALCAFSRILGLTVAASIFLQGRGDALSLEKRLIHLGQSIEIFFKNPLLGVGLGNYIIAASVYRSRFLDFINQPVHNVFLLTAAEGGIATVALFIGLFFQQATTYAKKHPYIFFALILTGSFDHYWITLQQNFLLLGIIIGLADS